MAKDSGATRPAGKKAGDAAEKAGVSRSGTRASASRQWSPGRLRVRPKTVRQKPSGSGIAALKQLNGNFAARPGLSNDRCPKPGKRHDSPREDSTSSTKDSDDNGPTVCDECFPPGSRSRDNELKGWRWKCAMCSDYDLCTSCVMRTKHDPSHVFVSSIPPGGQDVPAHLCGMPSLTLTAQPGSAHENVSCRACDGQVVGLRFKCAVCDNYDLCECCFRAGQPEDPHKLGSHNDQLHAWFLIRAPIKRPDAHSRFGSLWPYIPPRAAAAPAGPPAPRPVGRPKATASQQKPMTRNRSRQSVGPRDDGQESRRPRMKLRAAPEAARPKAKAAAAHRAALGAEVKSEPKSAAPKAAKRGLLDPARSGARATTNSQQEAEVRKRKLKGAVRQPGTAK